MRAPKSYVSHAIMCVTTFVAALAAGRNAHAGDPWIQQSPYPADVDLWAVHFTSPDHAWIAGHDNLLMVTTDGSQTWTQTPSLTRVPEGLEDDIWHMQFVDSQAGFAIGDKGYRTTNGGATWQTTAPLLPGTIYDFDFLTPQRGYAWNRQAMITTTNAGASWSFTVPEDFSNFILDADFFSQNLAILTGRMDSV